MLEQNDPGNTQLDASQQLLFKCLREWRKQKAEDIRVPVYIICTNKQAMELVKKAPKTIEALKSIEGFGKKKIESIGRELTFLIRDFYEAKRDCRLPGLSEMVPASGLDSGQVREVPQKCALHLLRQDRFLKPRCIGKSDRGYIYEKAGVYIGNDQPIYRETTGVLPPELRAEVSIRRSI